MEQSRQEQPDPIERGLFRAAEDGRTVFFPWGLESRGYVLRDDSDRRAALRAVRLLLGGVLAVGTWIAHALQPVIGSGAGELWSALRLPLAVLALFIGGYAVWAARLTEQLVESDLRVSRDERLRDAARVSQPRQVIAIGLLVVAASALLAWLEPRGWWLSTLGMAVGAGLALWGRLLARVAESGAD